MVIIVRRWIPGILSFLLVSSTVVWAQDITPIPPATPTLAPILAPSDTPFPTPIPPTVTPLPNIRDILPDATRADEILLAARNDIELLANATIGATNRPPGWIGSYDVRDPDMALKARLDIETLASQIIGERPSRWFGATAGSGYSIARDIRHDLELLADLTIAPGVRPPNWVGDDPVMRCGRATQALVLLLTSRNLFMPTASPASPTYCAELETEASLYTEVNLLDRPIPAETQVDEAAEGINPNAPVTIISPSAGGFYDRSALQRAGTIPPGTIVEPIARSYALFSRMTLIRGDNFLLFMDYQDATLEAVAFESLGDINVVDFTTYCEAEWCG